MKWLETRAQVEGRRAWLAGLEPMIIMGRGHSGTRVLSWICEHLGVRMGTDPDLVTGDAEDLRFTRQIKLVARKSLDVTRVDQVAEAQRIRFERALERHVRDRGSPSGRWGWKFPETYLIAPCVHLVLPRARYLHLVRDGRDLAFKNHLTDDPTRKLGQLLLGHIGAMDDPHHIQAAKSWAFQVNHYQAFREATPELPVLDLTFEGLISQPIQTTEKICAFLGIPFTDEVRAWIGSNITKGKIGQFQSEEDTQIAEVEAAIGDTLRELGYLT